jgi:hypothetical protein
MGMRKEKTRKRNTQIGGGKKWMSVIERLHDTTM